MGSIDDCFVNSVAESFFGTLQLELLDQHRWDTGEQHANAIFNWIESWYNPRRRHSYCGVLSLVDYEITPQRSPHPTRRRIGGSAAPVTTSPANRRVRSYEPRRIVVGWFVGCRGSQVLLIGDVPSLLIRSAVSRPLGAFRGGGEGLPLSTGRRDSRE